MQLVIIVLVLMLISMVNAYVTSGSYMWIVFALAILMRVVPEMTIYGMRKFGKVEMSKKWDFQRDNGSVTIGYICK